MKRGDLGLIGVFLLALYLSYGTVAFNWFFGFIAIYIYGYVNHCVECSRYQHTLDLERIYNEFHKRENRIKKLHAKGSVFIESL